MRHALCAMVMLAALLALLTVRLNSKGENVHASTQDCAVCHTLSGDALRQAGPAAGRALKPNLEAVCNQCHGDEGPSHQTGIAAVHPVPPDLPLTNGRLACDTCHYMHAEHNQYGNYLRRDNRRGGLCLTCHTLAELMK
ncbi:MAG: hypothetical protein ACYCW6_03620 [Candidatus Xenobia bacterium]